MHILVTGASGMLGTDVVTEAEGLGLEVTGLGHSDLDITDAPAVERAVRDTGPTVVVNCAAWTNVDGAESDEDAATDVNGTGAGNVARAAADRGAWTIHVSTDYVFDGRKRDPYLESDPVAPQSAYGRSKLAGEIAVADAAPGLHTIVRSSWLFGVAGKCFPATILRLASERDELRVVDDQVGCPTYTGHLARALLDLAGVQFGGILHVTAEGECSWFEFAREIIAASGASVELTPCTTEEYPLPASRPAYSVMRSERGPRVPSLPDWRVGLRDYLNARAVAPR